MPTDHSTLETDGDNSVLNKLVFVHVFVGSLSARSVKSACSMIYRLILCDLEIANVVLCSAAVIHVDDVVVATAVVLLLLSR